MRGVRAYLVPGLAGALVAFAVRLIFGDLEIALIGIFAFTAVLAAIVVISRLMKWQDAPMVYAAIAAIAVTVSFLASHTA